MKLGLFLTPGAARTAYQVGAVYALFHECRLHFDVIAASSVGALNGTFAAMAEIEPLAQTWSGWTNKDVLAVDWASLATGAVLWSSGLCKYIDYQRIITEERIRAEKLSHGTRLRFNLANLTTGEQEFFEWPGATIPLAEAVRSSVAVPSLIPPRESLGMQWADGLTVDGFPLERLLLETGVERVFVAGVAPREPDPRRRTNLYDVLLRAIDWNQESETTIGLERAARVNARIAAWQDDRRAVEDAIVDLVAAPALQLELLAEVERAYAEASFPYTRNVVEIVPILPKHDIAIPYAEYQPPRTLALIEQGRHDALAVVEALAG